MKKKILSLLLATTMALSLVACGGSKEETETTTTETETTTETATETEAEVETEVAMEYPDTIKVMFDGTVFTEANGRAEFEKALEGVMSEYASLSTKVCKFFISPCF